MYRRAYNQRLPDRSIKLFHCQEASIYQTLVSKLRVKVAPYNRLIRRVVQGPGAVEDIAYDRETLCGEEKVETQPSVFLSGQLDRVTAATEHMPLSAEIDSILATTYTHAPTYAYHVRDAILYRGSIYAEHHRQFIGHPGAFDGQQEIVHLSMAGLASTAVGFRYFGHWLRDDCIQYELANRYGQTLSLQLQLSPHMQGYARCFGQDWTGASSAIVDHLVLFQDYAQNSLKRSRYRELSRRIAAAFPLRGPRTKLVYIRRGSTGMERVIENEDALIDTLVQRGFEVVDVNADFATIVQTLLEAKLVVSVEGSNINHFNFCAEPGCGLLVLQPPDRFTAFHRHWADCVGVRFGFVVGIKRDRKYAFPITDVLNTCDMLLQNMVTSCASRL